MIIISYVSNSNGMGTWCWEAANSLKEVGEEVVIICSSEIDIPENNKVKVIRFNEKSVYRLPYNIFFKALNQIKGRLSNGGNDFGEALHAHLVSININPTVYIFNQANLLNEFSKIPQYTVAWSFPSTLFGYLNKVGTHTGWKINKSFFFTFLDAIGWYRKDWRGYRIAAGVISVSNQLSRQLSDYKINVKTIYPCIEVKDFPGKAIERDGKIKLMVSALELEQPRKRIGWMLDNLLEMDMRQCEVYLIGNASESFQNKYLNSNLKVVFYGAMNRERALALLKDKDILLFGSSLDDWGYVQTEAMAKGLVVIAPDSNPFDEIIGDKNLLFDKNSKDDFKSKILYTLSQNIGELKIKSHERCLKMFSRPKFSKEVKEFLKH